MQHVASVEKYVSKRVLELGNQIQILTGQILRNLGILLLNQSHHHIKIILTRSLSKIKNISGHILN